MVLLYCALLTLAVLHSLAWAGKSHSPHCKVKAGDALWPSRVEWSAFNASVGGRLVPTVPLASVCHLPAFNATACAIVQASWTSAEFHESSSSSIMSAAYSNRSCDPFTPVDAPCQIGTYVAYAVNASSQQDVLRTIAFAKRHNIRFVVRNTGHDYLGRSTGAGGLAIWMHYLKRTTWFHYRSAIYSGPAVTVQAGVDVLQLYEEAAARNLTVVGGHCPSVGYSGGYIQGGGHGPLSSTYGLAADDALEFEVITTTGHIVTASPYQHPELFWALRGGGGGTYAIVWSVTARARPDIPTAGAVVTFSAGGNISLDAFWAGIAAYRAQVPAIVGAGAMAASIYQNGVFALSPLLLPNSDADGVRRLLKPFLSAVERLGIPFNATVAEFPGFFPAYSALENPLVFAVQNEQQGGRLIPASVFQNHSQLADLNAAIRKIVDDGAGAFDIAVRRGKAWHHPPNAVLPAWDDAITTFNAFITWNATGTPEQARAQQEKITNVYVPSLKALTPASGAYLNEADGSDPDWRRDFYGQNYRRLLAVKDKYDPDQILYGATAVGGDRWVQRPDGHLCRV
ncbi:FAD binding domain protein [Auricularia subglabra TFB-10046 SS5]|nr:FAD binding domain protein [Auricularia subglabra TFB-10046 SS5]